MPPDGKSLSKSDLGEFACDRYGAGLFSRNPFRSIQFFAAIILFVLVLFGGTSLLMIYWRSLDEGSICLIFIIIHGRAIGCLWSAFAMRHRIQMAYGRAEPGNIPSGSLIAPALRITERVILDDLFYTYTVQLVVLLLAVILLRR